MCGIVLEFFREPLQNETYPNRDILFKMLDAIAHRGKDQVTVDTYSNCSIGFRRLAITDINIPQPQGNNWTVYMNGEIYNYKELGFKGSECEVIAAGLEVYGPDFIKRLNGMFVIVAIRKTDVYLFRDRYGIKPLYYFKTKDSIIAASEIKALLLHPKYTFGICESARDQWFVFNNILTDETLFSGIYKMNKGTSWHLNTGTETKYWEWIFSPQKQDYKKAITTLQELMAAAVGRQSPEIPYGTCLSGGLDSNIINALSGDIYTFSAGFAKTSDERMDAELTGKKHYEIVFNKIRDLDKTIYHLEDLRVGASWSNYGLYELISKYIKVCFDGAGGDELFAGYNWRYTCEDYYSIVNRTGLKNKYCEELFKDLFSDTLENRYKFDANYFLEGVLLVVDKLSMAHTLEMRLPFLDNDLVDFCLTLPNDFKHNKNILRDAFYCILPQKISMNQKRGFSSPDWFAQNNGPDNSAMRWTNAAYNEWEKQFKYY